MKINTEAKSYRVWHCLIPLVLICSLWFGTVSVFGSEPTSETKSTESENITGSDFDIREVLNQYRHDENVKQILFVRCGEGSEAVVQFLVKGFGADKKSIWRIDREC
ncbi:MAG: hypothetical protein HUJ73_04295, partial [Eubacterium sp.]|nr:hypothetical protein [Eubacterium sp.]